MPYKPTALVLAWLQRRILRGELQEVALWHCSPKLICGRGSQYAALYLTRDDIYAILGEVCSVAIAAGRFPADLNIYRAGGCSARFLATTCAASASTARNRWMINIRRKVPHAGVARTAIDRRRPLPVCQNVCICEAIDSCGLPPYQDCSSDGSAELLHWC